MTKPKVHIIAGGQFGSEGKGAFAAAFCNRYKVDALIRVAGPNAGHTAYDTNGRKWSLRQIPVGAVVNRDVPVLIGQGSEVDFEVLLEEIDALESAGISIEDRLMVDGNATVLEDYHKQRERDISTGSTHKGIGAARASRLMREASRVRDFAPKEITWGDTLSYLRDISNGDNWTQPSIMIEGTQGYGLGLHTDQYPYVTSSNTRPGDFLAMTGLQPNEVVSVPWLVFRTHPIRIAGNSGPLRHETTWEELGQAVEYTTVTHLPRRVGQWDQELARQAIQAAGGIDYGVRPVLQFIDYEHESFYGMHSITEEQAQIIRGYEVSYGFPIHFVGTGPNSGVWRPSGGWVVA
jgi:adenylosuccinate synthase